MRKLFVRLSVCLSVCHDCDKTEERSVQIFIPYEKIIYPSFLRRRMVGLGRPLLPEILGQLDFQADYITVTGKHCLPVPVFHFWPKL